MTRRHGLIREDRLAGGTKRDCKPYLGAGDSSTHANCLPWGSLQPPINGLTVFDADTKVRSNPFAAK
jgi:hypothetical protein